LTIANEVIEDLGRQAADTMHAAMYEALANGTDVHYANVAEGPLVICDQQIGCTACRCSYPHYSDDDRHVACYAYKPRVIEVYDHEEEDCPKTEEAGGLPDTDE
jgi:hypothetical protein